MIPVRTSFFLTTQSNISMIHNYKTNGNRCAQMFITWNCIRSKSRWIKKWISPSLSTNYAILATSKYTLLGFFKTKQDNKVTGKDFYPF